MNSPPLITSRANTKSRRTRSRDDPSTPLLRSIGQTTSERRKKEEAELQVQRLHVVSSRYCWCIYAVLALLYAAVVGTVYLARRSNAFVPPLPALVPGQTAQGIVGQMTVPYSSACVLLATKNAFSSHVPCLHLVGLFNPYTALSHLEAITTTPHPHSSRANTNVTKAYILDQFKRLEAEAVALGRRNVRYDHSEDNSSWTQLNKSKQQQQMEERGETEPSNGEKLQPEILEVVQGDNLVMWVGGVVESTERGVPVKIEIDFDQESQAALLVSAHYGRGNIQVQHRARRSTHPFQCV